MISDQIKTGVDRAPHRSLLYALGLTEEELERIHAILEGDESIWARSQRR